MKKILIFCLILLSSGKINFLFSQAPVVTVEQITDTIAIKGMPLQPVLKIKITTSSSAYTLSKLDVKSFCEDFTDVDSVAIIRTSYNRFSAADYENDWISDVQYVTGRKAFSPADSLVSFSGLTYTLQSGDNYIWVFLDLSKTSVAGHYLKVKIPKESVVINGVGYPAAIESSQEIPIRQVYFSENFNNYNTTTKEPVGWTQECLEGCDYVGPYWQAQRGGYGSPDVVGSRNPNYSKSGTLNARLVHPYFTPYSILMKSKPINLLLSTKPKLVFYHAQMNWLKGGNDYIDSLGVYYKLGPAGQWKFLTKYTLATPAGKWVKREITLPDEVVDENFYIGFKGTAQWGFGVCVDSVKIFEAGSEARKVNSIIADHPIVSQIPQGATKNPMMRINIRVKGNTGSLTLNALTITSNNTSNSDISNLGVKLFATSDSVFDAPVQVGSPLSFSASAITFGSLNKKIETGNNYFWVTYDVNTNASPDNILDFQIKAGDISITNATGTWPDSDLNPAGNRIVKQTVFFDDFETDKGWGLRGSFQRGAPLGEGGKAEGGDAYGRPDPTYAYSNSNVIGTTLTGDGNYLNNLTNATADTATSPIIEGKYFKNTRFSFNRWLNIESQDSAVIEYKYVGESVWRPLWSSNQNEFQESNWRVQEFDTKNIFDRKNLRLRFRLGPTSVINRYSGWNIDYLFVTGDSIKYDAAVTKYITPKSACSLTASEHLKVTVKNTGPKTLTNFKIKASIDGGKNWISETIPGPLTIDDSMDYQFTTPIDLSKPAIYNIIVKVDNAADNYPKNDSVVYSLTSIPTYSLPYATGFEQDTTFWSSGGLNPSWVQGFPRGDYILSAPEGAKVWKTDNLGRYNLNENSYVESPCFNFSGIEKPIVDFQSSFQTQFKEDGAILEYSLNEGTSWNYINGDSLQFTWKWYKDIISSFSDQKGWTGLIGGAAQGWQNTRRFVSEISNHPKVKFRISFKTTNPPVIVAKDGFAFDDFRLFEAPHDAGVTAINNLTSPACQFSNPTKLQVTVKNFGLRDIKQNDTIIIGIKVNSNSVVKDTFKLSSDLNKNASQLFSMTKAVNIVDPGTYKIKAFVIEKFPSFFGTNNDTTTFDLVVNPNPITDLPDTIYTAFRDTLKVDAYNHADYLYDWKYKGVTKSTTYQLDASLSGFGMHNLNVQNSITGCTSKDSVFIKSLIRDVGVKAILSPTNNCGYKSGAKPQITIENYGTDTLRVNQKIPVYIRLNKETVLNEEITLSKKFAPDSLITVSLVTSLNLLTPKTDTLKIWTKLVADDSIKNDTAAISFQIYGYPYIFLGNDTTIKGKLSHELNAGAGHKTILWSDGITATEKFTVSWPGKYYVTVTDNNDCASTDTIKVHMVIHDLKMRSLVSPVNACKQTASTSVQCRILNAGTDTISTSEPITLFYEFNNGEKQEEILTLSSELRPNDSLLYTFTPKVDMSSKGIYNFKLKSILAGDIQPLNDSILKTVEVFGNPTADLGQDRIVQALSYNLYPGKFASYKWQDNSTDTVWTITKTKFQSNNTYIVEVTDDNGCTDKDTAAVFLLINDLQISEVILPPPSCSLSDNEIINVKINNFGNAPLTNKLVDISYSLNGGAEVKENFNFNGAPGTTVVHTFSKGVNMSAKGNYSFKFKIRLAEDVNPINDTTSFNTKVLGFPIVDFKAPNDTIVTKLPYTLHAGPGYPDYYWQDNSTDSIFTITQDNYVPANPIYSVIVTDVNGCSVSKEVRVIEAFYDLGITGINTTLANCTLPPEKLRVTIKNNSSIGISNKSVTLSYTLNGGAPVNKTVNVSLSKGASQTVEFDENVDMSAVKTHNLALSLNFADDEDAANNSSSYEVKVFGNPAFHFDKDTLLTKVIPSILDGGEGYSAYKWNNNTTDRYLSVSADGWYSVIVTDINNCSTKDSIYFKKDATSTGWLNDHATVHIYPNPAINYLHVSVELDVKENLVMEMISQTGKVVYSRKLEKIEVFNEEIDVSGLPEGLYYLRLFSKDSMVVYKVVVK